MTTHTIPDYYVPTGKLMVPAGTIVNIGDYVSGVGMQPGTMVIGISGYGDSKLVVILNKKPWTGETVPNGILGDGSTEKWFSDVVFSNFDVNAESNYEGDKTLSFKEEVRGWVSFKSFIPENAVSMANDYYTFINGKLFKHHIEDADTYRNTFYKNDVDEPFTSSSVNVILNDKPSIVKSFHTLNYEGSQSKVDKFTTDVTTGLTDGEYYNLEAKPGWHVESIETDQEKGSLNEFVEKEGKWFNYLRGQGVITDPNNPGHVLINEDGSSSFDQASFAIQGIGTAHTTACVYGCVDASATNYNPLATCDDGSCLYTEPEVYCGVETLTPTWDCDGQGNCYDPGNGNGTYPTLTACNTICVSGGGGWGCTSGIATTNYNTDTCVGKTSIGMLVDPSDNSPSTTANYVQNYVDFISTPSNNYQDTDIDTLKFYVQGGNYISAGNYTCPVLTDLPNFWQFFTGFMLTDNSGTSGGEPIIGQSFSTWTSFIAAINTTLWTNAVNGGIPQITTFMTWQEIYDIFWDAELYGVYITMDNGYCQCDGGGVQQNCICEETPDGQYGSMDDCEQASNCCGGGGGDDVYGCTDRLATNYNPLATLNDDANPCRYETVPLTCGNIFGVGMFEGCDDFLCLVNSDLGLPVYAGCANSTFASAMDLATYWANEITSAFNGVPTQNNPGANGYLDPSGTPIGAISAQEMYDLLETCCITNP